MNTNRILFNSDYMEVAHPEILRRLSEINLEKNVGYGHDPYCEQARKLIRQACNNAEARVEFLIGGTQTNSVILSALLQHNDAVIAAHSGHINVHEAGAIEATGHKVIAINHRQGVMDLEALEQCLHSYFGGRNSGLEHYAVPRAVYISQSTEWGTLYTLEQLQQLRKICDQYHQYLMVDGARLGYALAAPTSNVTLADLAHLADVFYIGGTKVGAMFGEAVVVTNPAIRFDKGVMKNRGALLAKGFVLGVQFATLFTDELYLRIAHNAVTQALQLKTQLQDKGYELYLDSYTNQQFFVVSEDTMQHLDSIGVGYDFIEDLPDGRIAIRFATSWATTPQQIQELLAAL